MGDVLYVGSCAGEFIAFDKTSGRMIWSYRALSHDRPASFHGDPTLVDSLILTPTDQDGGGELTALVARTGKVAWTYPDPEGFSTDLLRSDSVILAVNRQDELHAFDPKTGEALWFYQRPISGDPTWSSSPIAVAGRIYFGSRDGTVSALDPASGDTIWVTSCGGRISTALAQYGDKLLCGTANGLLFELSLTNGQIARHLDLGALPSGKPLVVAHTVVLLLDEAKELVGVSLDSLLLRWRHPSTTRWSSDRPQLWHGLVLAGDEQGTLHAFDPTSGDEKWTHKVEGTIRGIGTDADMIFLGTFEGRIDALKVSDK